MPALHLLLRPLKSKPRAQIESVRTISIPDSGHFISSVSRRGGHGPSSVTDGRARMSRSPTKGSQTSAASFGDTGNLGVRAPLLVNHRTVSAAARTGKGRRVRQALSPSAAALSPSAAPPSPPSPRTLPASSSPFGAPTRKRSLPIPGIPRSPECRGGRDVKLIISSA